MYVSVRRCTGKPGRVRKGGNIPRPAAAAPAARYTGRHGPAEFVRFTETLTSCGIRKPMPHSAKAGPSTFFIPGPATFGPSGIGNRKKAFSLPSVKGTPPSKPCNSETVFLAAGFMDAFSNDLPSSLRLAGRPKIVRETSQSKYSEEMPH